MCESIYYLYVYMCMYMCECVNACIIHICIAGARSSLQYPQAAARTSEECIINV